MKEYGPAEIVERLGEQGFPITTAGLKKIEEIVLVDTRRKKGSRRKYSEDDLRRFRFICCFRALGFGRPEIREFLSYETLIATKVRRLQGLRSETARKKEEQEIMEILDKLLAQTRQALERFEAIANSMEELTAYLKKINDKYWDIKGRISPFLVEFLTKHLKCTPTFDK